MNRNAQLFATLCAIVFAVACLANPAAAQTTHDVAVGPGFAFTPAELTIEAGDTVRWTWAGGAHNVISGEPNAHDGAFHSGDPTNKTGVTFEVTFDQNLLDDHPMPDNVYIYHCGVHGAAMMASVTVEVPEPTPGDLNDDGTVNVSDLLLLLSDWGDCPAGAACPADLNDDDTVNVSDLLALLSNWG